MYNITRNNNSYESNQPKQQLVNYIYDVVNLSRFKFELLQYESELHQLSDKKYFMSANFSGSNCLLVFAKIRDKFMSFLVDRKTLSYNAQKVNLENVKITNIKIKLDLDIYQGTIFDGIYIQGHTKTFVITDVYTFKGQDLIESNLDSKLLTIMTYLKSNYNETDGDNEITLAINKLYNLTETEHVVNSVIPKIKSFSVRGICFYPEKSGTKLVFLFGNENREPIVAPVTAPIVAPIVQPIVAPIVAPIVLPVKAPVKVPMQVPMQVPTQVPTKTKTVLVPKATKTDESYVFEMKKTEQSDVYMLHVVEPVIKNGKTQLKRRKIGLAFVPNLKRSEWCSKTITSTNDNILVNCKYHINKMKWEPFAISTAKRPSCVDEFDVKIIDE